LIAEAGAQIKWLLLERVRLFAIPEEQYDDEEFFSME